MTDERNFQAAPAERNELLQEIIALISARPGRSISFRDYMELCLYHPVYGYYMQERRKIGREGDFYTSSSIGTVMGDMIGDMYIRWAADHGEQERLTLIEWGGGDGTLARHMLERVQLRMPSLYERTELIMIEHSAYHRRLQQEQLAAHRVRWMDDREWRSGGPWRRVYVWANELLDAMPVHRVRMTEHGLREIAVTWDAESGQLGEVLVPPADEVQSYVDRHGIRFATGQVAEINLAAEIWIRQLGRHIADGHVTLIDYGDEASEIYAPHRMLGTLMCYRSHLASTDPYAHVGEQDITAHVDFTACLRAAEDAGFRDVRLETQAEYLLRGGVLSWLQDHHDPDPFSPVARRNRSIRQLLVSDQMSELFKVMTAVKRER